MRLPFFYGWIIIAVTFVTMAIGVNARTSFSLLFPPILNEFGWERGVTAGAFSFGFLVSAVVSPLIGRAMDRTVAAVLMTHETRQFVDELRSWSTGRALSALPHGIPEQR